MESNGTKGLVLDEPLIFEKSSPGRVGIGPAHSDVPAADPKKTLGQKFLRDNIEGFPDLSEMDAVRHYTRLSQWNFGLDSGFYPLGSCTMKYNPKINEAASRLPGFAQLHPYQPVRLPAMAPASCAVARRIYRDPDYGKRSSTSLPDRW